MSDSCSNASLLVGECKHCGCIFEYIAVTTRKKYCSSICRISYHKKNYKGIERGPCVTCGKMFISTGNTKKYCDYQCFLNDPDYREKIKKSTRKSLESRFSNKGIEYLGKKEVVCLECGIKFYVNQSQKNRKYCSNIHRREYMAKRFDRWIASPEGIALPQNYDEFMTKTELPCLIEGCDWTGRSLGGHLNLVHGIIARDFKKAAGFSLSTGLVSPSLFREMSDRQKGVFTGNPCKYQDKKTADQYRSLEGKERYKKAIVLRMENPDIVERECNECGLNFKSDFRLGKKYCSKKCSRLFHIRRVNEKSVELTCDECGNLFIGSKQQKSQSNSSKRIVCGKECLSKRMKRGKDSIEINPDKFKMNTRYDLKCCMCKKDFSGTRRQFLNNSKSIRVFCSRLCVCKLSTFKKRF